VDDRHRHGPWDQEPLDQDGAVDVTLIDETLAMSVEERLRQNDRMLRTVNRLRTALSSDRKLRNDRTG
jgi:hypothetical protein